MRRKLRSHGDRMSTIWLLFATITINERLTTVEAFVHLSWTTLCGYSSFRIAPRSPPIEFAPTLCRVRPHTFRVRPHQVEFEFAPWLSDIQMSWFVTKALAECAKCHVSDDHFEFRQLRGTCLGTGLTESTKYSAWDLGLPEITVYTELVIKRTTLNQNNIA